uniref:Filamentous growth regulator 27 n=1 Tax=Talaromyces marneffei PM1 TaxID=1077442 RepID=A0A093VKS2_TALMA
MSTKLRAACDNCHRAKVRCSGQLPCQGCLNTGALCFFSLSDQLGRPKGTKNRSSEESRKRSNTGTSKAAAAAKRANNNKRPGPLSNNKDSSISCQPATTATTASANITPDINDHELNGSSSGDSYREGFDFLNSHNTHAPFDGSLHITPNDSDFSNLLWTTDTGVDFVHELGLSNENEVMLDPISALSTVPPMDTLLGKQPASTTNSCACMQQQVDLLFKSKILNNSQPGNNNASNNDGSVVSIDVALALVEEGMKAWQTPIMCTPCRCNDDQEVILLAFMSIQAVTRYFQRLLIRNRSQLSGTPPRHVDPGQCPARTQMTIGAFQVQGEDRLLLLKTLVLNTVRKLSWILTSLRKILEEKVARFPPHETAAGDTTHSVLHGDVCYTQHMFNGLAGSLQSIQDFLSHP